MEMKMKRNVYGFPRVRKWTGTELSSLRVELFSCRVVERKTKRRGGSEKTCGKGASLYGSEIGVRWTVESLAGDLDNRACC